MQNAPIAFFAYNRPEHTKSALESLAMCEGAKDSELFVFCDAPKTQEDKAKVDDVRKIVRSKKWCGQVNIVLREHNLGLADSITSGVSDICGRYGKVIVLEDDLVQSPLFLDYMNRALEFYKDSEKVMHIAAYTPDLKTKVPDAFFYRATTCWGWGTWKRAWDFYEPDAEKLYDCIIRRGLANEFNVQGSMNFLETLEANMEGKLKTWAIKWYASVFLKEGLCLHPGHSLIMNIGLDGSGVNCGKSDDFNVILRKNKINDFPSQVEEDKVALAALIEFYKSLNPRPERIDFKRFILNLFGISK